MTPWKNSRNYITTSAIVKRRKVFILKNSKIDNLCVMRVW